MTPLPYLEDPGPGTGRLAPRADFRSDAPRLSLNGDWRFRLCPAATGTGPQFPRPDLDDSDWDVLTVPSHWVLQEHTTPEGIGTYGGPLYTSAAYPFPLDPPRVPADNPTGDHRRRFDLPADWPAGRTVLRFQGVDSCARVWLNGTELGHAKGSRLPFEFDVTGLLRPAGNLLAVRVHRWSSGSYLEDQDMWWLPGIFRDVELLARPDGAADDFFVHASYDHRDGSGTLRVDAAVPGLVELPELSLRVPTGRTVRILAVQPWSAEVPRLYRGTLHTGAERAELAVGFRTVTIEDGRLLVNGAPVLFRGVNRHEHDPDRGRALDVETMRRDVVLMKRHNINAVRTSHYPPHPEFLRLCDEYGLWVVDECDIETHGFIYAGWRDNPPDDPAWRPALLDRVERMVERDKNHPSVVLWSLANESADGATFADLERFVRTRDPDRPIHYERDRSYRHSDVYSLMYPSLDELAAVGRREEPTPEGVEPGSADDVRRRGLPFLLCEYAHAMGNGPGSLVDYQRILEEHDRFCGAFVWEWIDHGLRAADGGFMHGGDVDFRPTGGRFCLDGLLFPDRTPSPGLVEYTKAVEPVAIGFAGDSVTLRNRYDTRDLGHLRFLWSVEDDGAPIAGGELAVPAVPARGSAAVPAPEVPAAAPGGERWLTVRAVLAAGTPWAPAGHEVAWGQHRLAAAPARPASPAASPAGARPRDGWLTLGPARFDPATGRLVRLGDLVVDGPVLDVWRAPIENDHGQGGLNDLVRGWRAVGLDRLAHRTDGVTVDEGGAVVVAGRSAPAGQTLALRTVLRWLPDGPDSVLLEVGVTPEGIWTDTPVGGHSVTLPRLGLRLALPGGFDRTEWFGHGPGESYADSRAAARVGRFGAAVDALQTPYPVPQENGNHVDTRWLELTGAGLPALRVEGVPHFDFTVRRWSTEALDRATRPGQLRPDGRVWLNVDHAQQGLGSASCGPALPDRYRLPVRPYRFAVRLTAG
ncbi:glycoside hydrolase family 2 TIM barrel-domain containing protein [Dactylosporangium sp. AC04546]|uniref:glycoside hydrolase family 2 TIM barrel-domain containing protein n=1 Tax=Dactylosporangium sp. AC04546 TaxID=2862460 RepID=UPI001EDE394E|nr:glycoside hydrolase family 2 TIM barrel-domain containing protein [Dactylosporangium sp. AC04546]WVK87191.1 glycoside hydrolase family 2 TIM barrel-domain containing protein [Dactylosporangium sp. AC04546]